MAERIAVGIIRRPHGVRGEASVEPWTDSVERLGELESLTLVSPDGSRSRDARVETVRPHGERALMKFSGVDTPEDVQSFQNWTLEIDESRARQLDPDEYFLHDLVGLTIEDQTARLLGEVSDVAEGGGGVMLIVRRPDGKTFELPFAADFCTEIDRETKKIVVRLPEGLDDLDSIE